MAECSVPSCDRADTRRYINGHLCPDHAPGPLPAPPPGTTAAELRARGRAASAARRAEQRQHLPRSAWTVWGTSCSHDSCGHDAPHAHGYTCNRSCPCRKRPELWRDDERTAA